LERCGNAIGAAARARASPSALSVSHFHAVEADPGRLRARVERLKSLGLIKEVKLGRGSVIYLTDLGYEVASLLEKKAAKLNIFQKSA